MDLDAPIILIGTHRSGTTWLGGILKTHPSLAFWGEPRHVWTRGNAYIPHDRLTERHAKPRVARHIRATFERFVRDAGRQRLAEKTPSNCLRVPFIRAIYPEAKILFVVRDGRSVLNSSERLMTSDVPKMPQRARSRALQTPLWEWPAYAPQAAQLLSKRLLGTRLRYWGPRPPGWKQWVRNDPPDLVLAKQWAATMTIALDDTEGAPEDHVLRFRYEDLVRRPREVFAGIARFLELPDPEPTIEMVVESARPDRAEGWKETLSSDQLARVGPIMEPVNTRLGYQW